MPIIQIPPSLQQQNALLSSEKPLNQNAMLHCAMPGAIQGKYNIAHPPVDYIPQPNSMCVSFHAFLTLASVGFKTFSTVTRNLLSYVQAEPRQGDIWGY